VTYSMPLSTLKASLYCASKKDVRFYLNGAYLDFQKGRIVSTDGHRLFVGQIDCADFPSVIVPRETIEDAIKLAGKRSTDCEIQIETPAGQTPIVRIVTLGGTVHATAIDGRFPEYERVIPTNCSGEVAQFNPEILVNARAALNSYMGRELKHDRNQFHLRHNGGSAGLMLGENCLCVVMPMRSEDTGDMDWYSPQPALAVAA
jgi:DNA polymerase III sliding clamp (beta) subunit (PCNA family)